MTQAAAAVDYPLHIDTAVCLQDAQVGHVLQLGDQPPSRPFQGLRQRAYAAASTFAECPCGNCSAISFRRFLCPLDAVVVRYVAGSHSG